MVAFYKTTREECSLTLNCRLKRCILRSLNDERKDLFTHKGITCSQTLYFLFIVRRARVIKYKPQGFIDRQRKGVVVGEEKNRTVCRHLWEQLIG